MMVSQQRSKLKLIAGFAALSLGLSFSMTGCAHRAKSSESAPSSSASSQVGSSDQTTSGEASSQDVASSDITSSDLKQTGQSAGPTADVDLGSTSGATSGMASNPAPLPTDAEIAKIMTTTSKIDIDTGKLAEKKSTNIEVKKLAKMMVTDHTKMNAQAMTITKKAGITPKENPRSESLQSASNDVMSKLQNLSGKDFDKAYIDQEVAMHQALLTEIDHTLLPNAKDPEIKTLIENARPKIQAHLDHAKHIQSTMQ
jgi:putative membrane protein